MSVSSSPPDVPHLAYVMPPLPPRPRTFWRVLGWIIACVVGGTLSYTAVEIARDPFSAITFRLFGSSDPWLDYIPPISTTIIWAASQAVLIGSILGFAQALVLRRSSIPWKEWIIVSVLSYLGAAAIKVVAERLSIIGAMQGGELDMFIISVAPLFGALLGVVQMLFWQRFVHQWWWWLAACMLGYGIGNWIGYRVILIARDMGKKAGVVWRLGNETYVFFLDTPIFWLIYGCVTGMALWWLLGRTREETPMQAAAQLVDA